MRGSTKSPAIQKQPPFIRTPIEEEPPQPLPSVPVPMPHREVSTPTTVATTLSSPDAFPFALPPPALADELSPTRTERKEQRGSPSGWSDSSSSLSSVPSRASSIGPLAQQQPYKPSRLRQNDAEWTSSSQEDRPEEDGPVEKEEPEPAPEPKLAKVEPAPSQPLLPLPLLALVEIPQSFRQMLSQVCHVSIESLQKPEEFFKLKKKLLRKLWNFIAGARVGLPDSFRAINPSGLKRGQLEDGLLPLLFPTYIRPFPTKPASPPTRTTSIPSISPAPNLELSLVEEWDRIIQQLEEDERSGSDEIVSDSSDEGYLPLPIPILRKRIRKRDSGVGLSSFKIELERTEEAKRTVVGSGGDGPLILPKKRIREIVFSDDED